jgi:ketosteroid isomerase-like protein
MSNGALSGHDRLASYVTDELATIHEVEHGTVSVGGGAVAGWTLRTTTTFRREDGAWKVVHRHADPISTIDVQGPLRTT